MQETLGATGAQFIHKTLSIFSCFVKNSSFHEQLSTFTRLKLESTLTKKHLLDEPVKLLFVFWTAEVCGPRVADGELVELQHVHDAHLSHSAAEQLGPLIHTCRWGSKRTNTNVTNRS